MLLRDHVERRLDREAEAGVFLQGTGRAMALDSRVLSTRAAMRGALGDHE